MVSAFLIPFRETLEATLIVGVVLAYLHKTNNQSLQKHVYFGVAAAIVASILTAIGFQVFAGGFSGTAEEIFEGVTMLLASGVLTYVVFWMAAQTRFHEHIQKKVDLHLSEGKALGLAALSFFAVYREGVETILFMGATAFAAGGQLDLPLALAGIGSAMILGYLVFNTALRFRLKTIFAATSILLILFAAGLFAHGVHEFQEAGVLPTPFGKIWNTNWLLDEASLAGTFAKALFGYNADPFGLEAIAYAAYLLVIGGLYISWLKPARAKHHPHAKTR
ncbi:MAG: FTR1 family protein [Candidatus Micrarchaeota archaeon]|nr:FTR1 family protein [Candidatus Micrarchaeota archaeon]